MARFRNLYDRILYGSVTDFLHMNFICTELASLILLMFHYVMIGMIVLDIYILAYTSIYLAYLKLVRKYRS
ncbi:hypothetical protein CS542_08995 [Pedobacter sp. IW39]|nr:hypothetical protein CS542_08995 [Pedobacter sp. IW39]